MKPDLVKKNIRIPAWLRSGNKITPFFSLFLGALLLQLTACQSYKKIPYFQNVSSDTASAVYKDGVLIPSVKIADILIQPNDILNITIQTLDPEMNAVFAPAATLSATSASMTAVANTNAANGNTNLVTGYLVDKEGYVELPVAGKVKVAGLTTAQAKEEIRAKASAFYKSPIINVQIVNFKVTVVGEVARPGAYLINGERATIMDALGQAGDLTIYGMRENVLLSRKEGEKQLMIRFDLTSADVYNSPYFYLKQGDMIYVTPSKAKANSADGTLTRTYAIISSTLALLVVLATRNY